MNAKNKNSNEEVNEINKRISKLESECIQNNNTKTINKSPYIEIFGKIFNSWTIFGYLILILFYSPLKEIINTIPNKIKASEEVDFKVFSLREKMIHEVKDSDNKKLSETLPNLSSGAIIYLLRAPHESVNMIPFNMDTDDLKRITNVGFPHKNKLEAIIELQERNLIEIVISTGLYNPSKEKIITGKQLTAYIADYMKENPGKEIIVGSDKDLSWWRLDQPQNARESVFPNVFWGLTGNGKIAVDLIINVLEKEFTKDRPL